MSDQAFKLELSETVARLNLVNEIFDPNSGNCSRDRESRYGRVNVVVNARHFAGLIHHNLGSIIFSFSPYKRDISRLTKFSLRAFCGGAMRNTRDIVPAIGNKMSRQIIDAMQRQGINIFTNAKNAHDEVMISKAAMGVFLQMLLNST